MRAVRERGVQVAIGLDVGTKTIGVAVTDAAGIAAHPRTVLERTGNEKDAQVACDLGLSINAVLCAKSRILNRLRQESQGLLDDTWELSVENERPAVLLDFDLSSAQLPLGAQPVRLTATANGSAAFRKDPTDPACTPQGNNTFVCIATAAHNWFTFAVNTQQGVAEWTLDPKQLAAAACQMAGRNLTRVEWATFMSGEPCRRTCPDYPAGT